MMMTEAGPTPDAALRTRILQALALDQRTALLELRVGVVSGIAHLAGQAPSVELWILAEQVVSGVAGVRGVVNRIEAPDAPSPARAVNLDL